LLSRSANGAASLRLMDFEEAKEKFAELYRAYNAESARNRERAELMKEGRLAAIVLEFSKTDVRFIQPDFHERFLDQRLPADLRPAPAQETRAVAIPGLGRTVQAAGARVTAAKALTDSLLRAKAVKTAGSAATAEEQRAADETYGRAREVFNEALEFAGKDFRLRKKRLAAPDRIADACKDLEQCVTDLVLARGNGSLDEGAFDDALLQLRAIMERVAVEAGKSIPLPGE